MSSKCTNDGQMNLDVTFELGTNLDMAQVLVQNRVSIAEAKLPEEVKRQGVTTKKKSPSILLCVNLISEKTRTAGRYKFDQLYLSNYRHAQRQGRPGPHQGRRRRDVPRPARLQHAHLARPGQAGGAQHDGRRRDQRHPRTERPGRRRPARPAAGPGGPGLPAHRQHAGPAEQPKSSSANIIVKTGDEGQSSISTTSSRRSIGAAEKGIELGAKNYDVNSYLDGEPSVTLAVFQLPGSNALDTAEAIRAKMEELKADVSRGRRLPASSTTRPSSSTNRSTSVYQHADRGVRPGLHRRAGLPAELAGHDHPDDRRAGVADRHVRRHGAAGVLAEQPVAVRPGAGDRHRRG